MVRPVVRQNNPIVFGCPCQDLRVILSGEANVLDANDVEIRLPEQQAADNVPVEVLIGQQSEHSSSLRLPAGEQSSPDFAQVALLLVNAFANFFGLLLASS